nr:hypothetical protein [Tanacetum cinerariifolium]
DNSEGNQIETNNVKVMQEDSQENVNKELGKSYDAAVQNKNQSLDTSLSFRPTVTDDDGCEFVVFDEELVDANGGCFFKFKNEDGMEKVIEQAQACKVVRGRADFARVLVEFDVKKGFKEEIEVNKSNGEEVNDSPIRKENKGSTKEDEGFVEDRMKEKEGQKEDIEDVMEGDNICARMCSGNEIKEHSVGGSQITNDMQDLIDCANDVEMEDINSTSLFYTWIKSLTKPKTSIIKNLDIILVNGRFMNTFAEAYGQFLPSIISEHSVALLIIPRSLKNKIRSFRFTNYILDKEDFLPTVEKEWNQDIIGHNMYNVVKKLKAIKQPMRKLKWKNGNLTEKVELCKDKLKVAQRDMARNPYNERVKAYEAQCLAEYLSALNDEEKFLFQKAKVKWISNRDRNTKFFHKCISKIITNRIKGGLDKLINANQSAFVPGKVIQDNLMITQELLKGYNYKNGPSRCYLKIDIAKLLPLELIERDLVTVIKKALLEFNNYFGLKPNMDKSVVFFGSVKESVIDKDIHDARMNVDCSVADRIKDNEWIWPVQ